MKTKITTLILLFLLILAGITGYMYFKRVNSNTQSVSYALWEDYKVVKKNIEGKQYTLVVADNPKRWEKGLMFVRKPTKGFDGMIFIFPTYEYKTFWNLNTYEDLTLYWMKDDTVTNTSQLPSIDKSKEIIRVSSSEPVNIVVEIIN